jgi:hypothetical protein
MPVLVRNLEDGPTVFSDGVGPGSIAIEFAGAGDPESNDVQQVPESVLENFAFLRALQRGIFEVVEATDEIRAKLTQQGVAYRERRAAQEADAAASIHEYEERPIQTIKIDEKTGKSTRVEEPPVERRRRRTPAAPTLTVTYDQTQPDGTKTEVSEALAVSVGAALPDQNLTSE